MKLTTKLEVIEMMGTFLPAAALSAALELGLFWRLVDSPKEADALAMELNIPGRRCYHWLRVLADLNLLEQSGETFALSPVGRSAIIEADSAEAWAMHARDAHDYYPLGLDLTSDLGYPGSIWSRLEKLLPGTIHSVPEDPQQAWSGPFNYVHKMTKDPQQARLFTQMLYEIHLPLAEQMADALDMSDVQRFMDLGGGSGVISHALLRRNPHSSAVVVDIPTVCAAGQKISEQTDVRDRISFYPADFLIDELPVGFDLVIECDIVIYSERLFQKIAKTLNENGRFYIADRLIDAGQMNINKYTLRGFRESLNNPNFMFTKIEQVCQCLNNAGFDIMETGALPYGMQTILAVKQ